MIGTELLSNAQIAGKILELALVSRHTGIFLDYFANTQVVEISIFKDGWNKEKNQQGPDSVWRFRNDLKKVSKEARQALDTVQSIISSQ